MSQPIVINIGALPNDGTGDPLRTAFNDTNLNFANVFTAGPVGSNVQIANNSILTTNTNGNLVLVPNGTGMVQSNAHVVPNQNRIRNLGSPTLRWDTVYVQYANIGGTANIAGNITAGNATLSGDLYVDGNLTVEGTTTTIDSTVVDIKDKNITLAFGSPNAQVANGGGITIAGANAQWYYNYPTNSWQSNITLTPPNITFPDGSVLNTANTVHIGEAPIAKGDGNLWFNSDDGRGYVKYNNQWIEFCPPVIPNPATYLGNLTIDGAENSTLYFPPGGEIVFGDDTVQTTAFNGNSINFANVTSSIIPAANVTYSLGNSTNWWANAWFGSNTIYIGGVPIGVDGDTLTVDGANVITATNLPVATNSTPGVVALGNGFSLNSSNQVTTSSLYNTNLTQPTQHYALSVDTNGVVILPDQSIINGSTLRAVAGGYAGLTTNDGENSWMWVDANGAYVATQYNESGNSHQWTFDNTGNTTFPTGGLISNFPGLTGANNDSWFVTPGNGTGGVSSQDGQQYIQVNDDLFVEIGTGYGTANAFVWQFGLDGTFAASGNISTTGNISGAYILGNGSQLTGLPATYSNANVATFMAAFGSNTISTTGNITSGNVYTGGIVSAAGNVISSNAFSNTITLKNTDDYAQIVFSSDGGTTNNGQIKVDGGTNMVVSATSNFYVKRAGSDRIAVTDTTADFMAATNVRIQSNKAGSAYTWTFDNTGNLTVPGNIIMTTGIVGSGASPAPYLSGFSSVSALTLSASGNVTAANFIGNGATLSNIATQVTGSWTLAAGTNTVSLTVPGPGTYSIWVNGNIPLGIVTYTATVVVTNTNVPVVGSSYGWYYAAGNALVLTAIPTQVVGTLNNISTANVATTTANVFEFGITNNSGNSAVVNYGYTKL